MGIINDIIDLVKGRGKEVFSPSDFTFKATRNSLSRKSAGSIMQFPVICSNALSVDELMMVNKALEREYVEFVRIAASLDDVIDVTDPSKMTQAKLQKVQSLHQNMGYSAQRQVGLRSGKMFVEGTDLTYTNISESEFVRKNIELLQPFNEDLNTSVLNDLTNKRNRNYYTLGEATKTSVESMTDDQLKRAKSELDYKSAAARFGREKAQELKDDNFAKSQMNTVKTMSSPFKDNLLASDVKKANELVPSMLNLTFVYNNGVNFEQTHMVVGVKTVAHQVTSDEMMHNIATAVKDKRTLFRFIQATTGEIETVKDFILAAPKIKDEVRRQRSGEESKWWRRLKNRATSDRLQRFSLGRAKQELLPNSTLVLTMDEVEMIYNNYGINLLKDKRAVNALFSTFFLLGVVIVDSAAEIAYFSFDGQEDFQTQSFRSLDREGSGASAADVKALINLTNKR